MVLSLTELGYSEFFAEQMAELDPVLQPARVIGQHRRQWDLAGVESPLRAVLAGKRWDPDKEAAPDEAQPTVGDWVAVRIEPGENPVIEIVLTRRTSLTRASMARGGQRQAIVSNIDRIFVVAAFSSEQARDAMAKRSLHPRRLERYIAAVERGGAKAVVLLNKADIAHDAQKRALELNQRLKGVPVIATSAKWPNAREQMLSLVEPQLTYGFVGLSGVGKSSLVNLLLHLKKQRVSEERAHDGRGRHTTTHRELFFAPNGAMLIDTPGMREFSIADGKETDLNAFADIQAMAVDCRFRDCTHVSEPGCAVLAAVQNKGLELDRLENFRQIASELQKQGQTHRKKVLGAAKKQAPRKTRTRNARDFDDDL